MKLALVPGSPDGLFFKPKIPIWVNFGRCCHELLLPFYIFYDQLEYFIAILYILWSFGVFSPFFGMLYRVKSSNPG
jgi:hypothetical protein